MSEEAGFLAALAADPADAVTRLAYADWLEERGDIRGELLRIDTEMAALPAWSDRAAELRPRRRELRAAIDPAWQKAARCEPRHRPLFTKLPDRRVERWRLVEEFIDTWHGPLKPGDGCTEEELAQAEARLGFRLPSALREWHALAGKRADVWSVQDGLMEPRELRLDRRRDLLVIRAENQWCESWGIRREDLRQDDPPVIEISEDVQASPTTTAFACVVLLGEAKFGKRVTWAGSSLPRVAARRSLQGRLHPCDVPDRYWMATPLAIYEGIDLLVELHGDGGQHVAARNAQALQQLSKPFRDALDFYG